MTHEIVQLILVRTRLKDFVYQANFEDAGFVFRLQCSLRGNSLSLETVQLVVGDYTFVGIKGCWKIRRMVIEPQLMHSTNLI